MKTNPNMAKLKAIRNLHLKAITDEERDGENFPASKCEIFEALWSSVIACPAMADRCLAAAEEIELKVADIRGDYQALEIVWNHLDNDDWREVYAKTLGSNIGIPREDLAEFFESLDPIVAKACNEQAAANIEEDKS